MRIKTWVPAVLAVVLGAAAAYMVRQSMVKPRPTAIVVTPRTIQVAVAATDLMADQELRADNLTTAMIPAPTGPLDYVANPAEIVGRVLNGPVLKGQTILQSNLKPRGATGGIASLVPSGMRAMTINVDEANSIAGMLLPGCHVDVVTTLNAGKKSITRTLVKNVLVQAVGQRLTSAKPEDGKEPPPFRTVTMIVSPREAQIIDLASTSARMRLVLRPLGRINGSEEEDPGSTTLSDITGVTDDENVVASVAPTTAPSVETPELTLQMPRRTVELIKGGGGASIKVQFDMPRPAEVGTDLRPAIPSGTDEGRE